MPVKIVSNKKELIAVFVVASLFVFSSCKKDQLPPPSYLQATYFYIPYSDVAATGLGGLNDSAIVQKAFSANFSFFFLGGSTITRDTFWLPTIRVMGNTSPVDREITLVADSSNNTAVAGKHYALLNNYVVKADSFTSKIGVVLFRSPDLNDTSVTLALKLQPNAAFPTMVANDTLTTDNDFFIGSTFRIVITNRSVQPPYWADVQQTMGAWSRVKYQFIIDNTGKYLGLTPNNLAEKAQLVNYYFIVTSALQTYNNDHPDNPLKDENGNLVTFSK